MSYDDITTCHKVNNVRFGLGFRGCHQYDDITCVISLWCHHSQVTPRTTQQTSMSASNGISTYTFIRPILLVQLKFMIVISISVDILCAVMGYSTKINYYYSNFINFMISTQFLYIII